ncbi:MAG: hypothetical protein V3U75_07175 [Methylococcaceae bacterium]
MAEFQLAIRGAGYPFQTSMTDLLLIWQSIELIDLRLLFDLGDHEMKTNYLRNIMPGLILLSLPACMSHPVSPEGSEKASNLTVGRVQGEIKEGIPASDVASILGSPNIVTTDEQRREVWIYDKVSSNRVDTQNSFAGGIIILGGSTRQSQNTSTQKTLTIIIKYDEQKKVRDFAYNYTQF